MPKIATFVKELDLAVLASNSSSNYTASWSKVFANFERVAYILLCHASGSITFNVQIATDSSGTSPTSLFTDVVFATAGEAYILDVGVGALTDAKQFVSALATRGAGTYSLLRVRYDSRTPGGFSLDDTVAYQSLYI